MGFLLFTVGIIYIQKAQSQASFEEVFDVEIKESLGIELSAVMASDAPSGLELADDPEETAGFIIVELSAVLGSDSPFIFKNNQAPARDEIITYTIKEGDTLSEIAEQYGISVNTILWANDGLSAKRLSVETEIALLPVSGVRHKVVEGDTLSGLARKYKVSQQQIIEANDLQNDLLVRGEVLTIPGGKKTSRSYESSVANNLPSYSGFYTKPTNGYNWGSRHGKNGVDIANRKGTAIYVAASGRVTEAVYGWNGGYGNMISIKHNNGTRTLYAHLDSISVSVGDQVSQGEYIAGMGNSGRVVGPTGNHLHFEVQGARNPFVR